MEQATLQAITTMLTQLGIAGIALWAWTQERSERQASQKASAEREAALHEKYQLREKELHTDYMALIRDIWRDTRPLPTMIRSGNGQTETA